MPVLLHVADTHLGARRYGLEEVALDAEEAFDQLVEWAARERPDALVVSGDFFDKPRPDNRVLAYALRSVRLLVEKGVRVVFALGEHDTPPRRDRPAVAVVAEAVGGGVYAPTPTGRGWGELVDSVTVDLGGFRVVAAPFFKSSPARRRESMRLFLDAVARRASAAGGVWVLAAHIGLTGYTHPDDAAADPADLPPVAYAALGHVHKRRLVTGGGVPYAYPGSLVPLTIDEVLDQEREGYRRGAFLVEVEPDGEARVEEVPIEEPRVHVVVATTPARAEEDVAAALRRKPPRRGREPVVHLILYLDPGERMAAGQGVRGLVASLARRFNALVRVARVHYRQPRAGGAVEEAGEAVGEEEVVASLVGDAGLARALVALKEALLSGDADSVDSLVAEIVGDKYAAAWRRLLGRSAAPKAGGRGLEGWL